MSILFKRLTFKLSLENCTGQWTSCSAIHVDGILPFRAHLSLNTIATAGGKLFHTCTDISPSVLVIDKTFICNSVACSLKFDISQVGVQISLLFIGTIFGQLVQRRNHRVIVLVFHNKHLHYNSCLELIYCIWSFIVCSLRFYSFQAQKLKPWRWMILVFCFERNVRPFNNLDHICS